MIRKDAIPLIRQYISEHRWIRYFNPVEAVDFNIEQVLLEDHFKRISDPMDRAAAIATTVATLYRNGPLELVNAPKAQMAEMGQAEFLLDGVPVYLIHLDTNWYIAANEFFPFPES